MLYTGNLPAGNDQNSEEWVELTFHRMPKAWYRHRKTNVTWIYQIKHFWCNSTSSTVQGISWGWLCTALVTNVQERGIQTFVEKGS